MENNEIFKNSQSMIMLIQEQNNIDQTGSMHSYKHKNNHISSLGFIQSSDNEEKKENHFEINGPNENE